MPLIIKLYICFGFAVFIFAFISIIVGFINSLKDDKYEKRNRP